VFSIIACGTDDTGSDQYPPIDEQTGDARVVLDARVSHWTDTSQSIIINESAIYRVRHATGNLQYPEDDADMLDAIYFTDAEGEGGGTLTKVRCNNDGHFNLLESFGAMYRDV